MQNQSNQSKLRLLAFQHLRSVEDESKENKERREIEQIQHYAQKLYIQRPYPKFFSHQMESYEQFMYKIIKFLGEGCNSVNNIFPKEEQNKQYFVRLVIENPTISPLPTNNNLEIMTPDLAYQRNQTYSVSVVCDGIRLEKVMLKKNANEGLTEERILITEYRQKMPDSEQMNQLVLFKIPVMVRSRWCSTSKNGIHSNLDKNDPGCFFICNGQSKTISPLERSPNNKIVTYHNIKKDTVNAVVNSVSFASEFTNKNILQVIYSERVKFAGIDSKDMTNHFLYVETSQFDNQGSTISTEREKTFVSSKDEEEGEDEEEEPEKVQINDSKDKPSIFLMLTVLGITDDKEILQLCAYNNERVYLQLEIILQIYRRFSQQGQIRTQKEAVEFLQQLKSGKLQMKLIEQIIISDIIPHCCDTRNIEDNYTSKAQYLGLMVYKVICVYLKLTPQESRDSYLNKRVVGTGELLYQRFEQIYKKSIIQNLRYTLFANYSEYVNQLGNNNENANANIAESIKNHMIDFVVNKNTVTAELENSIITGKWTVNMLGIAKQLPNSSIPARTAALKMVSNTPVFKKQNHGPLEVRHVNNNQIGFYCPVGSPDGQQCGIIKEMALSCDITVDLSSTRESVSQYIYEHPEIRSYSSVDATKDMVRIFVFGKLLYLTDKPQMILDYIREGRFSGKIPRYVTYEVQGDWNEILIYGDSGRMIRPFLVLEDEKENTNDNNNNNDNNGCFKQRIKDHNELYKQLVVDHSIRDWEDLIAKFPKSFEWADIQELSNKMIAASAQILEYNNDIKLKRSKVLQGTEISYNVKNRFANVYQNFDLLELHPINVLGINPSTIPYPHCNYGPRNIFAFVQMKRGVQKPYSDNDLRQDINQFLILGSAPLVQTMTSNLIDVNRSFNGTNICVAVLMENGFQQEDSITISSRLARTNYLQCKQDIIEEVLVKQQAGSNEILARPEKLVTDPKNLKDLNYDKLDKFGLVKEGSVVKRGDVIIGKVLYVKNLNGQDEILDKSVRFDYDEGIVIKVKQLSIDGQQKIIIRFLIPLYPQIGDKYAARCGQKGTIGTIRDENLMPYTSDGTPIDIIINPCSFSTRMTIGMNIEHYTSYLSLLTGMAIDSSMFCDVQKQLKQTYQQLIHRYFVEKPSDKIGEQKQFTWIKDDEERFRAVMGQKKVYTPLTGECIDYSQVGFVFYAAQEQKASSKLYAVGFNEAARNQVFQPREGGKNHGGSRLGEMETAAFLSAGLSNIIKVFAQQHSDGFNVKICSQCGIYASRDQNQNKWYCRSCDGKSQIVTTAIQYSSKYLKDLMNSIGISLHYMPNKIPEV